MKELISNNPKLIKEWNYEKNVDINPNIITIGSGKKVWWKCSKGHEWKAEIRKRVSGTGCPYCSNQKILKGYNDLATTNPEILKEWDYEKNDKLNIFPNNVVSGSSKKVWWKCSNGHEWQATIVRRTSTNSECPICANRQILKGYNDLTTTNPTIAKEWNYEKNDKLGITPYEVGNATNKKVWWKCSVCNYEWLALISSRTITGNGCPNCRNDKVRKKFNENGIEKYGNLVETHPYLIKEWDYEKNNNITPNNVHQWSSKKVWWKCYKGHTWQATIYQRAISNTGCPVCNGEMKTSFPEQTIFFYLSKIFSEKYIFSRYLFNNKYEIDIFIKKHNIGIEYDGFYFHNNEKTKKTENQKNIYLENNNIKLIRIKEKSKSNFNDDLKYDVISINKDPKYEEIDDMIVKLINRINELSKSKYTLYINSYKDRINIMQNYISNFKKNSLKILNPNLAKEWNYEKNGNIKPDMVTPGSRKKVWWICSKGHEWEYSISDRNNGDGCPYCSNHKVLKGYNDLATTHPNLMREWDYEKNDNLNIFPNNVISGSSKKVWWICSKGHEWECSLLNKTHRNASCPYCSNRKVLKGYNDLATTNPDLVKEWNYDKNDKLGIIPENVSKGSHKKVWWKCSNGHEWQANIYSRTNGSGCPKCVYKTKDDEKH